MNPRNRILAIDTGHMTGLALWTPEDGIWSIALPDTEAEDWLAHEIFYANRKPTELVLEQLAITQATIRKGRQVQRAIELAGTVKYFARTAAIPLVEQKPGEVMKFARDTVLKQIGWYVTGPDHQRDARRHILARLAELRLIDLVQLLPKEET